MSKLRFTKRKVPRVASAAIVVGGEHVGIISPGINQPSMRVLASLSLTGVVGLQGHGDTPRDAVINAISDGLRTARRQEAALLKLCKQAGIDSLQ